MTKKKKIIVGIALLLLLAVICIGGQYYVDRSAKNAINRELEKISDIAEIRYEDLDMDLFRKRIHVKRIRLSPRFFDDKILIDGLTLHQGESRSETEKNIDVRISGIRIDPIEPGGFLESIIQGAGYKDIRVDLDGSGSYDTKKQTLDIRHLNAGAEQVATIKLKLRLEGFNFSQIQNVPNNPLVWLTMMTGVSIADAELHYRDASLLKKILQSEARRKGQPVEIYVRRLMERIKDRYRQETDPRTQKIFKTLNDFLLSPRAIHILIKPEKPVSIFSLYWVRKPSRLLTILGVKVDI